MPDFHIVNNGEAVRYDNATESLSPELREALLRAFSRARLPDDDPLYAVLVAQAELLNSGFRLQLEVLKSTLDAFVSLRIAMTLPAGRRSEKLVRFR